MLEVAAHEIRPPQLAFHCLSVHAHAPNLFFFNSVQEEELKDAILLVFANKQDQPGALGAKDVSEALRLTEIRNRQWSIQETCALKGNGLFEGFDWLVMCISGGEVQ